MAKKSYAQAKSDTKATDSDGTKSDIEDRLKDWRARFKEAEDLHKSWEETFECQRLHAMWAGPGQWPVEENPDNDKYYVNLFFAGVEARRPSLVFRTPYVRVRAKPSRTDDPANTSEYRAHLFENTLNTILGDRRVGVLFNAGLGVHESFFRFGVVEVGIGGDVTSNPRAARPAIDPDSGKEAYLDPDKPVLEPDYLVTNEIPYVRRIPAAQVMVSCSNKNELYENDWIGYYDYVREEDIRANPFYNKVEGVQATAVSRGENSGYVPDYKTNNVVTAKDRCKLIKIWDLRTRKKYVFAETGDGFFVDGEPWKVLPLCFLKMHEILDSFYPLPPSYNWVQPQMEVNAERQDSKTHRRRFKRKYTGIKDRIDPEELDKLETGEDGAIIFVNKHEDLQPITDAPLDGSRFANQAISRQDFTEVSAIGAEQRQIAESETATQATIIDTNSQVRESFNREQVADWFSRIASTLLALLYEQASLPFWIYTNVDPFSPNAEAEATEIAWSFQVMRPEYLEDYAQWELGVDMASMMPAVEEREKQNWMMVLQAMTNQQLAQLMLASDVILRRTLNLWGIRSEKEILEIKSALQKTMTFNLNLQLMAASGMPLMPPFDSSTSGKPTATGTGQPPGVQGATPAQPGPMPNRQDIMGQMLAQGLMGAPK